MISETAFASGYSSFWDDVAPNSDRFIRRVNLNLDRYCPPIQSSSPPERRALINETSFRLFARLHRPDGTLRTKGLKEVREEVVEEARTYIARFDDLQGDQLSSPTRNEWAEISALTNSTSIFVSRQRTDGQTIVVSPKFRGCGILDACQGDLLIGSELIEVKAGDRPFRSTDVRQLLTYCALNYAAKEIAIGHVGCVNPRRGTYFIVALETLSVELSSKPVAEFMAEIIYFLSSGDISR